MAAEEVGNCDPKRAAVVPPTTKKKTRKKCPTHFAFIRKMTFLCFDISPQKKKGQHSFS